MQSAEQNLLATNYANKHELAEENFLATNYTNEHELGIRYSPHKILDKQLQQNWAGADDRLGPITPLYSSVILSGLCSKGF